MSLLSFVKRKSIAIKSRKRTKSLRTTVKIYLKFNNNLNKKNITPLEGHNFVILSVKDKVVKILNLLAAPMRRRRHI